VLDADCISPPDWLSTIHKFLTAPGAENIVAITAAYQFYSGLPWWGRVYVAAVRIFLIGTYRLFLRTMPFVIGGYVAFRRQVYVRCGGYPLTGGIAQTELVLAKKLNKYGVIRYVPGISVYSSTRRFQLGILYFFINYKVLDYFLPYFRTEKRVAQFITLCS
jgi:hypothetical protein